MVKMCKKLDGLTLTFLVLFLVFFFLASRPNVWIGLFNISNEQREMLYVVQWLRNVFGWAFGASLLFSSIVCFVCAKAKWHGVGMFVIANVLFIAWSGYLFKVHDEVLALSAVLSDDNKTLKFIYDSNNQLNLHQAKTKFSAEDLVKYSEAVAQMAYIRTGVIIDVYQQDGSKGPYQPSAEDITTLQQHNATKLQLFNLAHSALRGGKMTLMVYLLTLIIGFGYNRGVNKRWL